MAKKKDSLVDKVLDVVDQVIHPEHATQAEAEKLIESGEAEIPEEALVEPKGKAAAKAKAAKAAANEMHKHQKFDKFK